MAESTIQRRVSDPEFATQSVATQVTVRYTSSSGITATLVSPTNVSSVSATASGSSLSALTFNVAKSGYTLVGITTVPYATATTSVAFIITGSGTNDRTHARLAVSGNTIVATFSSSVAITALGTSYTAHLNSITCKYVKNN